MPKLSYFYRGPEIPIFHTWQIVESEEQKKKENAPDNQDNSITPIKYELPDQ